MTAQTVDPFAAPARVPTVTFDQAPVGTTYKLRTLGPAEKVQGKDFETGEPAVWKNKDGSTSPKYSAVVRVEVVDGAGRMPDGEERAIWAVIPSAMFAALQDALAKAGKGVRFAEGGELVVRYSGDKPNEKNPRLNPAKQYQAKYTPPVAAAAPDPFGGSGTTDDQPPW
jgi:hypothetical protein